MHFKRKRPKEHIFGTTYWDDVFYSTGNHKFRVGIKDLRKPQWTDGIHTKRVWRYKDNVLDQNRR